MFSALTIAFLLSTLTPPQAKEHVGEKATVCGTVVRTYYAKNSRGTPTFVDFEAGFTAVLWNRDEAGKWVKKDVCVTGTIKAYRGKPQMVDPEIVERKTQ